MRLERIVIGIHLDHRLGHNVVLGKRCDVQASFLVEIQRRCHGVFAQTSSDGGQQQRLNVLVFVELNFCLRGVNVDVQPGRIDGQKQDVQWVLSVRQEPFVSLHDSAVDQPVLDKPLIDEQKLLTARSACKGRFPNKPLDTHHIGALFNWHQALVILAPKNTDDPFAHRCRTQIK